MTRHPVLPLFLILASAPVAADEPDAQHADQTLVVARSVMPRVAYRGLEPRENPVRVEATTFPGGIFHRALDGLVGDLADDGALQDTAAPGGPAAIHATTSPVAGALTGGPLPAGGGRAAAPAGMGARIGGSVGQATGAIGAAVTGALSRIGGGP